MRIPKLRPALILTALATCLAQQNVFEVASVKPAVQPEMTPTFCIVPCSPGERFNVEGSRVDIRYMSLHQLIVIAYRIKPYQLTGPDWMKSQRFDIQAKLPAGASKERLPEMLQALLAERFKLAIHHDSKEQPVYALVVGKNGPKLREAAQTPVAAPTTGEVMYTPQGEGRKLDNGDFVITDGSFGPMRGGRGSGAFKIDFMKISMPGLADVLTPHISRPVIDSTGLKGEYALSIEIRGPGEGGGGRKGGPQETRIAEGAPDPDARPDPFGIALFAAIEKAGLKVESRKAPVDMIVVDHLEKTPAEN